MIYTITLNPAIDKAVVVENFRTDEVNRVVKVQQDPGGKGINVSNMINKLHGHSIAVMVAGGHNGEMLEDMLGKMGIQYKSIPCEGETRINVKVFDPIRKTFTDINEPGPSIGEVELTAIHTFLEENLKENDLVTLSGSIPKGVPTDIYAQWIELANSKGAKVILDASGEALNKGIDAKPFMIKPNQEELEAYFDATLKSDEDVANCGKLLTEKGIEYVVVSQGGHGCLLISDNQVGKISPLKLTVKSTVGAGDSMVAAIARGSEDVFESNETPDFEKMLDIVAYGAASSSASIEQEGTIMGNLERVNALYELIESNVWTK